MVEKYIITQAQVLTFFAMSEIPDGRFKPHILKAQDLDLKPILNPALYYDFLTKFDVSLDPMYDDYQKLINGTTYTYAGQTVEYPGLIPMLSSFTLARFLPMNPINVVRYGITNKVNPQSTPVDQAQISYTVSNLKADALKYQGDLLQYLNQNPTVYPLWGAASGEVKQGGSMKFISSAGRRGTGFGWWNGNYYP